MEAVVLKIQETVNPSLQYSFVLISVSHENKNPVRPKDFTAIIRPRFPPN